MAMKRSDWRQQLLTPKQIMGGAVVLGLLYLVVNNIEPILWLLLFCGVGGIAFLRHQRAARNAAKEQLDVRLANLLIRHQNALISYYQQDRKNDLFGDCDDSRWQKRIDMFLEKQLVPDARDFRSWRKSEPGQRAAQLVDAFARREISRQRRSNPLMHVDAFDLTPIEYERHCGDMLRERGWTVQQTPATRDGGADFVAERRGVRLVVQCKRYAHPVGNKAIQEVTAAVRLYHGNVACVVAPNGYTPQAEREATGLSVHLLHHSDLPSFADKLLVRAAGA